MNNSIHIKYLPASKQDIKWGLIINTVGYQQIRPMQTYPPQNHPANYIFSIQKGRVLDEYQLVYITRGSGCFCSDSCSEINIQEGKMFMLFPGEWHDYHPNPETGWDEYWIGFKGINIENLQRNEFFNKQKPVFDVGVQEDIVHLYKQAIFIAREQDTCFQQLLSGIVERLLGYAYAHSNLS